MALVPEGHDLVLTLLAGIIRLKSKASRARDVLDDFVRGQKC